MHAAVESVLRWAGELTSASGLTRAKLERLDPAAQHRLVEEVQGILARLKECLYANRSLDYVLVSRSFSA